MPSFNKHPRIFHLILGVFLIFTIATLDYLTGPEITFSLFYLLITVYLTWFLGLWSGIATAIILGILSELMDVYGGKHYSHVLILVWSAFMKSAILGFVAILLNRLQNRENKLRETVLELERSNRELDSFTSVVSHDLQAPLHTLKMTCYLLEKSLSSKEDKVTELLNHLKNSVERMTQLVKELLSYARIAKTNKPYEKIDLQGLIGELTKDLEALIKEKDAKIETHELPIIEANRVQMRQLFQNLISNALKYCRNEEPPRIKISSKQKKDIVEIYVKDNGMGFDEKQQDIIFLPFQRLHNQIEGTGIGLPICKKIVDQHGGDIKVESKINQGSTFVVRLPL